MSVCERTSGSHIIERTKAQNRADRLVRAFLGGRLTFHERRFTRLRELPGAAFSILLVLTIGLPRRVLTPRVQIHILLSVRFALLGRVLFL